MEKQLLVAGKKLAMRLMIIQILIISCFLNSYATDARGQEALDKKISFTFSKTPLKEVLDKVESSVNVKFVFSPSIIDVRTRLTFSLDNKTVSEFLNQIIRPLGIGYRAVNDLIILYNSKDEAEESQSETINAIEKKASKPTDREISGIILNDKREPVAGASVSIQGTKTGAITDEQGRFRLYIPENKSVILEITSIGYQTRTVEVNSSTGSLNITLNANVAELTDVVVVGYGTQKKETLTGSVVSVKGSEIVKSPAVNVSNSLVGRLPGLIAVNGSGEPGYDGSTIRIRGVNTFGNANPLIVVDGVPGRSLERLDPATVETISVLKDASAAIYGAQAANGVILVTTKRGKTGKPSINLTFNQGWGRPTRIPEMGDAAEYATLLNELASYRNQPAKYTQQDIDLYRSGTDLWEHPNTDWFKEVLKPWSRQNYGNASVSGGTENIKYFISLSTRSQDGFFFNSGTKYNQYDLRSNLDAKINKYLSLSVDLSGRMEDRNFPTAPADAIFRFLIRSKPNLPAYWPNGLPGPDIEYGQNPVVSSTKATGYDHDKRYIANTNFGLKLQVPGVQGLTISGNAAIDKSVRFDKTFRTPWYLYTWDGSRDANGTPVLTKAKKGYENSELNELMEDNSYLLLNGLINYERSFTSRHEMKVMAGAEKINGSGDNFSAFRKNFISSTIDQMFAGAVDQYLTNGGSGYKNARLNYFGRVNYAFEKKYLFEFVWRYQGSYIFEESSRYGFFPGVSLGYIISDENFWKNNIAFINYFKLRGSWGATGNDLIQPFQYLATYGLGGQAFITNGNTVLNPTLFENGVPNFQTTWEKAIQRNVGFDARFINNKLSVTADYFYNNRSNILASRNASVPMTTGITLPPENIGKSSNKGFDFSIDYKSVVGKISYQLGLNGGYAKNKLEFFDEAPGAPDWQKATGRPIGSSLYYEAIGIFNDQDEISKYPHWNGARPGDVIFKDINGDDKITADDRFRLEKSNIPTWTGGFNVNLQYKGFDLAILLQGAAGAVKYVATESGELGNYLKDFYNERWTIQNPTASAPRAFNTTSDYFTSQANTYWLKKSDYIRLKNVELGYTLPAKFNRWGIQRLRVYVNAFNLLTYSPDMKDFDPEMNSSSLGAGQGYPLQKIVNAGISLQL